MQPEGADVDLDEVRLDLLEVDRDARLVQPLAEAAGAGVVLGQPLDVVVEGVDARGGDDPGLAHRAAELVLVAPRAQHPLRRPRDDRAERAAEPLREADRDRVGVARDRGRLIAARDGGIEEPRAVEMERELELPARLGHRLDLGERPHAATRGVVRVLDRDDPCRRHMAEVAATSGCTHLLRRESPGPRRKRASHEACVHGGPSQLRDQDVRVLLGDQLVAGLAEHAEGDLVRHRRRGHEDRVLLAERLGGAPLELVDGRVLAKLLVAHLGRGDRLAHRRGRFARRVGAEVDHDRIVAAYGVGSPEKLGYRSVRTIRYAAICAS